MNPSDALYLFSGLQAAVMISLALDEAPLKIPHATTGGRIFRNSIFFTYEAGSGPEPLFCCGLLVPRHAESGALIDSKH